MKIPNPAGLISVGRAFVSANRPEILFGTSFVSTAVAVVMAARGGYKSGIQVSEAEVESVLRKLPEEACIAYENEVNNPEHKLDAKQIAQLTWLNYLPAAGATGVALGSTTGLHLVHIKEKKQLATATLIAMDQVQKEAIAYKKEVLESVGISKSEDPKELQKAANKSGIAKVSNSDGEIEELYLVRDEKTGRDIWSNKRRIEEAMLETNKDLDHDDTSLNSFYKRAGFADTPDGDRFGWNKGLYVGLEWDTTVKDDSRPVRTFLFSPMPDSRRY